MSSTSPGAGPVAQRIVFVLPGDGMHDSRTHRLAADLAARGHEVRVIARASAQQPASGELVAGVPVERVPAEPAEGLPLPGRWRERIGAWLAAAEADARRPRPAGVRGLRRLALEVPRVLAVAARERAQVRASLAADRGAAVYHAMGFLALPVALRLARQAGGRVVYDARDLYAESNNVARLPWPARGALAWRERRWAGRAAAVLTVNASLAALLAERWQVRRPAVLLNCSRAWTPPEPPPDLLRERLGLAAGTPLVLYHGGFLPDRGLPELIAALGEPGLERAHLVLLGSGPLEPLLAELAAAPAAGGRVHLLAPVPPDALLAWVASADVAAMPNQPRTRNERLSTPNKLFEALAAGVPVVSSDFPERRHILLDDPEGPLGRVCDPTDRAALAAALRELLDLPPAERAALRARILRAAHARYTWEAQLPVALRVYEGITGRPW